MAKTKKGRKKSLWKSILTVLVILVIVAARYFFLDTESATLENIPPYAGEPYVVIDDNQPGFTLDDFTTLEFEEYSDLDVLGRCGVAYANI